MQWIVKSPLALAALGGVLIGFSFIPGPFFLSWIAFLPLFYILQSDLPTKKKVFLSWIIQFVLTLIGFHWIAQTIMEFGRLPVYFGILGLLAFACFASLHFVIATYIYDKIFPKKTFLSLFSFLLLFVLCEWFYPMIFPWHMGYPWITNPLPIKQLADSVGFWGLSLLTLVINFWLFYLIYSPKKIKWATIGIAFFISLNLLGYFKKMQWDTSDSSVNFYVAQANIGNFFKYKAEKKGQYVDYIINQYIEMTREDLKEKPAEIVLWPETAMPIFMNLGRLSSVQSKKIAHLARNFNLNIITGVYSYKGDDIYNSIAHINQEGIAKKIYNKNQLLAFGEYFPGTENNPKFKAFVERIIPAVSHFARGKGPMVFDYNKVIQIGPHVCYEGLDPLYIKGYVDKGANIIINVTNDSWFGDTFEPYQHMYMTLARAIEFRRPLVRSTNTGFTTAITARGEILEKSSLREKKGLYYQIPIKLKPSKSLYAKIATVLPYILLGLWLVMVILIKRRKGKIKNAKSN